MNGFEQPLASQFRIRITSDHKDVSRCEFTVSHISDLSAEMTPLFLTEGNSLKSIPVRATSSARRFRIEFPITLGRPAIISEWWKDVTDSSKPLRKQTIEISLLSAEAIETTAWRLKNAWPCKIGITPLTSAPSQTISEYCEFIFEEMEPLSQASKPSTMKGTELSPTQQPSGYTVATQRANHLDIFPMHPMFKGENLPNNSVWPGSQVKYLTAEEREKHRLQVKEGKIFDSSNQPFDTSSANTHWSSQGRAICVMDKQGNIFASKHSPVGRFHHSSFLSGEPVAYAGEIEVEGGNLLGISNKSGHYRPPASAVNQFKSLLQDNGVDVSILGVDIWD